MRIGDRHACDKRILGGGKFVDEVTRSDYHRIAIERTIQYPEIGKPLLRSPNVLTLKTQTL